MPVRIWRSATVRCTFKAQAVAATACDRRCQLHATACDKLLTTACGMKMRRAARLLGCCMHHTGRRSSHGTPRPASSCPNNSMHFQRRVLAGLAHTPPELFACAHMMCQAVVPPPKAQLAWHASSARPQRPTHWLRQAAADGSPHARQVLFQQGEQGSQEACEGQRGRLCV